uniref:Uncharacterized protein LOC116940236 isoform X1 n=1 Tax=Petromyzon marinus TaxID=7757 RepID=A0AAJ7SVM1_PETMA|nr:uncharacterized protein LOC116940236 isoform X1 [Petromyzon marinus]
MTDVVVAEGSVKLREGKKWKTRWVVLKKPSPVADCLNLLAFKDRRDSCIVESKKERGKAERERHKERDKQKERLESERERADLFLESVCGLEGGLSLEGCDHVLAIISLTQVLLLGFDSPRSLAEWDEQLRDCLGEGAGTVVAALPAAFTTLASSLERFCPPTCTAVVRSASRFQRSSQPARGVKRWTPRRINTRFTSMAHWRAISTAVNAFVYIARLQAVCTLPVNVATFLKDYRRRFQRGG